MAVHKVILLFIFSCLSYVASDLDLSDGSPCVTNGLNGTCVNIFKCNSAALSYLYINAGFIANTRSRNKIPELPDICSHKEKEPVVCCTDCDIGEEKYRHSAVGSYGVLVTKEEGSVAREKCYEYFISLPYPCRFPGYFQIQKIWKEDKKCHVYEYDSYRPSAAAGGRDAQRWEFPHVALLGYGHDTESADWLCGGSVISERFILTAAHCSGTRALGNITFAALGLLKRTDPKRYWKIYKIKRIIIHPEYQAPSKYHDIALIETENEIAFGRDLLPVCLDDGTQWKRFAEASGWGRLGHKQQLADNLQIVGLNEFNETTCSKMYRPHRHLQNGYDHKTQMCYGSNYEIVDTCEGDSGGPLHIYQYYKCLYTVVGVTSYGKDCGILGSAGMYTRVSYYVPWIEGIVWPEETEARKKKDDEWLNRWLS